MHWLMLLVAIASEIVATSALKETQGFTRLLPSLLCIGGYALAFYLLSIVVRYVPVGIAYALWSGIGVVVVSLVGWFFFHQKLDLPAIIGLAMIIAGVAIMRLFSHTMEL
ncbi:MAG: multidrug efflux SMR transporter [Desulfovibrionaceae bacterium]|nr:multidrug efflux SMR transporter [Desulfovibrionaceae bacterium]